MNFVNHPKTNFTFQTPPGQEENCGPLRVFAEPDANYGAALTSYWQPTEVELANLLAGGYVALTILGQGHPPISLGVTP